MKIRSLCLYIILCIVLKYLKMLIRATSLIRNRITRSFIFNNKVKSRLFTFYFTLLFTLYFVVKMKLLVILFLIKVFFIWVFLVSFENRCVSSKTYLVHSYNLPRLWKYGWIQEDTSVIIRMWKMWRQH